MTDVSALRRDFPALEVPVHGHRLAYLDSASTALKPRAVIDAVVRVFTHEAGNVHRGVHALSEAATVAFDLARADAAAFLGADPGEIVLVRGTTEAINLVAHSWGRVNVGPGDAVIASALEHHSNLVPWQRLCAERGAELRIAPIDEMPFAGATRVPWPRPRAARGAQLRIAPIDDGGRIDLPALAALLTERVKLVAVSHLSNVVGTIAPIAEIARLAHAAGAVVLVDGAQGIVHLPVDVAALGCDFYAFSGHKLYAPTGAGVLWGRRALLEAMPPWQAGGEMVASVTYEAARYREPPFRFEAGTPDIAGVIGLGAALAYLRSLDRAAVMAHEARLHARLCATLASIEGVRVLGAPEAAVVAFTVAGAHPHDVATIADRQGVAIRAGHLCAEPLHHRFGISASVRASLALYNDDADLDALAAGLARVRRVLR